MASKIRQQGGVRNGIVCEALDNGFLSCAEPEKLQAICDSLGPGEIDHVFRKWLQRIPLPPRAEDRQACYDWNLSIWQMEVSLTRIFDRVLTKKTPGKFPTRVTQDAVLAFPLRASPSTESLMNAQSCVTWTLSTAHPHRALSPIRRHCASQ